MATKKVLKKTTPASVPAGKQHKYKLSLVYEPISKLKLWDKNPRQNDSAAEKLCVLFQKHGFINPVIATPDGVIRAGNTRLKAAMKEGYKEVPVIYVPFNSEAEAEMYSLADNKASEWAEWDKNLLNQLFSSQKKVSLDTVAQKSGFTKMEIEGIRARHADFASHTFAEAVEEFEKNQPTDKDPTKDLWVWGTLPDVQTHTALLEKLGLRKSKELNIRKLLALLRIQTGGDCPACKGTGGESHRTRCKVCRGTGLKAQAAPASAKKTPKKVKKGC